MGKKVVHVEFPAQDVDRPTIGWYARCKDTEGNAFSFFQSDESVPMPEGAAGA